MKSNDVAGIDPWVTPAEEVDAEGLDDDSIGSRIAQLIESGRAYVVSEMDRQKLRAGIVGIAIRDVAILVGVAAMLMFAAILALMVGLILALAPALTPVGATAAVVVGALLVAALLVLLAKSRITRIKEALKP